MRNIRTPHLLLACVFLTLVFCSAAAQEPSSTTKPLKYRMEVVAVFGTNPLEYIFVVTYPSDRKFACASVDLLKKCVTTLPKGSTLEWAPSDVPIGKEPLVSSPKEMADFKAHCQQSGINFVLIPAG